MRNMRPAEINTVAVVTIVLTGCAYIANELSGERISVIAALLYLISQHELNRVTERTILGYAKNIMFVIFIGFAGGWFVSNVLTVDYLPDISSSTNKVLQATFGFLSYEFLLLLGGNAKSVIKQLADMVICNVKKGRSWNTFTTSK